MIFGTPEYMAPEQASGKRPDARVDIYAVGIIMYELLTGQVPFSADTFMGVLTKHMFEPPPPPREINPDADICPATEAVLNRALAKEPDSRYQTIGEMRAEIERVPDEPGEADAAGAGPRLSAPTLDDGPAAAPASSRLRVLALVLGLVVAVGGVLAAVAISRGGAKPSKKPRRPAADLPADSGPTAQSQPAARSPGLPPDAAPPATHQLTLKSNPPGAAIFRGEPGSGDAPLGRTPATLELPRQSAELVFTLRLRGYQDQQQRVVPDRDREVLLQLRKLPLKPRPAAARKSRKKAQQKRVPRKKSKASEDLVDPYGD
jgi:serine/threonine-protein kinase